MLCSKYYTLEYPCRLSLLNMAWWFLRPVSKEHAVTQFSAVIRPAAVVELVYRYTTAHYGHYECDSQDERRYSIGSFLKRIVIIKRIANEHDKRGKDREDIKRLNQGLDIIVLKKHSYRSKTLQSLTESRPQAKLSPDSS